MTNPSLDDIRVDLRSEHFDTVKRAYADLKARDPRLIKRLAADLYWDKDGYICGFPDGRMQGIDVWNAPHVLWVAWSLLRDGGVLAEQREIKIHGLREVVFLKGLEKLETLDLTSIKLDSLSFLPSLSSVKHLKISGERLQPAALEEPLLHQLKRITIEGWTPEMLAALAANPSVSLDVFHVVSLSSAPATSRLIWPKTAVLQLDCPLTPAAGAANHVRVRAVDLRSVADAAYCEALAGNRTVRCLRSISFHEVPLPGSGRALQAERLAHVQKVLRVDLVRKHGRLRRTEWGYDPDTGQWFSPERQRRAHPETGRIRQLKAMDDDLSALGDSGDIHGFDCVDIHAICSPGLLALLQSMKPGCLRELHLVDVWEGKKGSVFSEYFAPHTEDRAPTSITVGNDITFNPSPLVFLAKALAEAPGLQGLSSLKMDNFCFQDFSFDVFCALAPLETLEVLSLRANLLTAGAGAVFAKHAAKLSRLRHLDLGGEGRHRPGHRGNAIGLEGVSALAASPLAGQLEYLDVRDNDITFDAHPLLYDPAVFPRLRWLRPKSAQHDDVKERHETTDYITALQQVLDQHPNAVVNGIWKIKAEEYRRRARAAHRWDRSVGPEGMTILARGSTVTIWLMIRWAEREILVYYFDRHQFSDRYFTLSLTEDQFYLLRCASWPMSLPMPDVKKDLEGLTPHCHHFRWDWS